MGKVRTPDGTRMAVCFCFDIDAMALWLGFFRSPTTNPMSRGKFGLRVAMSRILDKDDIKATFFTPGHSATLFGDMVQEVHIEIDLSHSANDLVTEMERENWRFVDDDTPSGMSDADLVTHYPPAHTLVERRGPETGRGRLQPLRRRIQHAVHDHDPFLRARHRVDDRRSRQVRRVSSQLTAVQRGQPAQLPAVGCAGGIGRFRSGCDRRDGQAHRAWLVSLCSPRSQCPEPAVS